MSQGATFKLTANDGKADRMIMASSLLRQRINDVVMSRKAAGKSDLTPTLIDIERTHILFVNAHFKPYAAIAFEYNKVKPTGSPVMGGGVTFSLPQYGDFFYDIVVRTRLSKVSPKVGRVSCATGIDFTAATGVDGYINGSEYYNLLRYCEYPGHRLFQNVSFEVNGNPIDSYDSDTVVLLDKFNTEINKRNGYNKLVGQQVPIKGIIGSGYAATVGYSGIIDADVSNTPQNTIGVWGSKQSNQQINIFQRVGAIYLNDPENMLSGTDICVQYQTYQTECNILNGPQTPQPILPPIEIWNKLKFWFNDNVNLAIASVSIPFGQRFINIDLCDQDKLIYEYPLLTNVSSGDPWSTYFQLNGTSELNIEAMEMYINNIFLNPEIHDIYIRRIGFALIRVYRKQKQSVDIAHGSILLSQLKWPVEYLYVGFRPRFNTQQPQTASYVLPVTKTSQLTGPGNWATWRDWHRMTRELVGTTQLPVRSDAYTQNNNAVNYTYTPSVTVIDSMGLISHGITIYDSSMKDVFYNQYMPYNYGGYNVNTPEDPGAFMINMALYPRSYQPSGHINISRARETYITYSSTYISSKTPCDAIIIAVAINFLLITDGSAILRYST